MLDEPSLTVDEAATMALRDELRAERVGDGELFDFGDGNGAAPRAPDERAQAAAPVTTPA
jgi:hypothetical protein